LAMKPGSAITYGQNCASSISSNAMLNSDLNAFMDWPLHAARSFAATEKAKCND